MNTTDNRHSKKQITFTGKLLDYSDYVPYSNHFIETGAAAGDGIMRALIAGFEYIISIEAAQLWYDQCRLRFNAQENVQIMLGRSTECLNTALDWCGPFTSVIYLDAHPAGPLSAGHDEWLANPNGESNQHNIICAELSIILAHRPDHLIIIDDVNGMDDGCADEYMRLCLLANSGYRFEFWDEDLSGNHRYINKILVCLP